MKRIKEEQIPKRIKKMRLERNMTQKDLADAIGVTKGYISRIENSRTAPPVGKLLALAQAMHVEINAFLGAEDPEVYVTVTESDKRPVVGSGSNSLSKYEHLALNFPNRAFEAYVVKIPKNSKLPHRMQPKGQEVLQHKGQELLYVLKGSLNFNVDGTSYNLKEGDAIYFDSSYPHFGANLSGEELELLIVVYSGSPPDE